MTEPKDPTRLSMADIVSRLAPTLGQEKGQAVVAEAVAGLGFAPILGFTSAQVSMIFDVLERTPGLVGLAARFARSRAPDGGPFLPPFAGPADPFAAYGADRLSRDDLVALFAGPLGEEKAREVVAAALDRLGTKAASFDREQSMTVLDALCGEPGLVGTVARFAKVRLILRPVLK